MKTLRRFSQNRFFSHARIMAALILIVAAVAIAFVAASPPASAQPTARTQPLTPKFSAAVAFDVSPALHDLVPSAKRFAPSSTVLEVRPERGPVVQSKGYSGDAALQALSPAVTIPSPLANFEGLSNQDNFNIFGFRVNPPDPNGAVGPNHYVEMINLVFAVYDKAGNKLLGPVDTGTLWAGFAVPDCTDASGDPIVLYDKLEDHWILTQFTTRGPYYNCVAVSMTGDPTGAYFRYAFLTTTNGEPFFPDYPKYGNWKNSYVLTSRDFGDFGSYGISVYALEKDKMNAGDPSARMVHFFIDGNVPGNLPLVGDGLLPPDFDGTRLPKQDAAIPIVGTHDDGGPYGATFDALNIWELNVKWQANSVASITLKTQLPVASFDSIFPCGPAGPPGSGLTGRDCLPQPGIAPTANNRLDILSYRQRPTFRLAYRNFGTYESLVTNQSVEAMPSVAGVRWYEIRRTGGTYSVYQQGTYAPGDGVHRWMGS